MSEFPGGHLETGKISVKMTTCLFGTLPNQKQCHEIRMALQQPFFSSLLGGRMHSSSLQGSRIRLVRGLVQFVPAH